MRAAAVLSVAVLAGCGGAEDLTLRVEVPEGTEPPVYVAGSFNDWDPSAEGYALRRDGAGWVVTIPDVAGTIEFKLTRGSWTTVEVDSAGADIPNRSVRVADADGVHRVTVARWRDPCDWPLEGSTATASVSLLDCDFAVPQLERTRRVWLYLPPGYRTSGERYPVLYMHDGQNVFDAATSYSGEWAVDEALDSLHAAGDHGAIVVAVDNGGEHRLDEYSPWRNAGLGAGGEGEAYVAFLVDTLKPYVDAHYRTRPERRSTAIAGSSMGGLISLYAALEHPDVFGSAAIFSPAFWFAPRIFDYVRDHPPAPGTRLYMVTGGREGDRADEYAGDHQEMAGLLESTAPETAAVRALIRPEGTHSEQFWRREFTGAYRWLFEKDEP